jgi:prolycopene isomerase
MINAGMVFSDRHYGGINYPKGGVGKIAQTLADGLEKAGGEIRYKARVKEILLENRRAVGVKLTSGEEYRAKRIVSNATRWDTFKKLLPEEALVAADLDPGQRPESVPVAGFVRLVRTSIQSGMLRTP